MKLPFSRQRRTEIAPIRVRSSTSLDQDIRLSMGESDHQYHQARPQPDQHESDRNDRNADVMVMHCLPALPDRETAVGERLLQS